MSDAPKSQPAPRVVVFGYSEVGYVCLELLLQRQVKVAGVFTHPDQAGEHRWFRSVAQLAEEHRVPVFKPASLKEPSIDALWRDSLQPDLVFSFYYRQLIPMRLLETARLGAYNLHGSYLPKYRGKAPVNWAVLNGEDHLGATLHVMVRQPDAGDIVDQERVLIGPRDTAAQVMTRVVEAARLVLARQLDNLLQGRAPRRPQDHRQATYFSGRRPEDGRIDWTWPTARIFNLIRAVTRPYPGAFADFAGRGRLLVWWAEAEPARGQPGVILNDQPLVIATGDGALRLTDFEWKQTS